MSDSFDVGAKVRVRSGVFSSRNSYDENGNEITIDAVISKVLVSDIDDKENSLYEVSIGVDSKLPMIVLHRDLA